MQEFETLKSLVLEAEDDVNKEVGIGVAHARSPSIAPMGLIGKYARCPRACARGYFQTP